MNKRFYYTYGMSESQPFQGGWSVVWAKDRSEADKIFQLVHPNTSNGLLNCGGTYDENTWELIGMETTGNFGKFCHEVIEICVTPT